MRNYFHNQLTPPEQKRRVFLQKAKYVHGNLYDYSKVEYVCKSTPIEIVCKVHGSFSLLPISHLRGSGCPSCKAANKSITVKQQRQNFAKQQRQTKLLVRKQAFIERSLEIHKAAYSYEKVEYINNWKHVTITCSLHGDFQQRPKHHLIGKGCPACGGRIPYTTNTFIEKAQTVHNAKYDYACTQYQSYHVPLQILCHKHGIFEQTPNNHLAGSGCPKCVAKITSNIQRKVANWISKQTDVVMDTRNILKKKHRNKGLEIDIYCPEHRLGIEVNGLHWHSETYKPRDYHYHKALLAKRSDIKLLQFWEHELKFKPKICQSMIRSHLGLSARYYARQLEIKPLSIQKVWFDRNHLAGGANAAVTYGLFNGEECLAAMSFGCPRFNREYEWEIIRFANALNVTVVGGASKLWKHFLRMHAPKSCISYADLRISQGDLYRQLGFQLSHRSAPNYVWHKNIDVLTRYQTQKHKLKSLLGPKFDEEKSEAANMQHCGWRRVFDAGNLVYVWNSYN